MCSNIWPSGARPAYIYHVIGCIPAGTETLNKHYLTLHFKSGDQKKKKKGPQYDRHEIGRYFYYDFKAGIFEFLNLTFYYVPLYSVLFP